MATSAIPIAPRVANVRGLPGASGSLW